MSESFASMHSRVNDYSVYLRGVQEHHQRECRYLWGQRLFRDGLASRFDVDSYGPTERRRKQQMEGVKDRVTSEKSPLESRCCGVFSCFAGECVQGGLMRD